MARLQRDLGRAQAHHALGIAELGTRARLAGGPGFAPALTRSACFEGLLDLGLTTNQARRVLHYLEEHRLAQFQDA